ncbi:MAG: glutamyl-tRNA synthetase, partial [uncultured bacterium]
TCCHLSSEEVGHRQARGLKPTLRFRVPENAVIEFVDLVKGPQRFSSNDIGDFIVRRADGTSPFLFCNAIDDALMRITHVLRGDDHLTNTPRQILILQALNLPLSQYGHLSLITGDDGTPLSKRHGSFSVQDLQRRGFLPQAVINYLARLGHTCEVQQLLNFDELAMHFNLEKLSRSPAHFDHNQIMYWQKISVQLLDKNRFLNWLGEDIKKQIPENMQNVFVSATQPNIAFPHDAAMWSAIFFSDCLKLEELDHEALTWLCDAKEQFFIIAEQALENYGTDFSRILVEMKQALGISGKRLFMPLRIALTGKVHGPELALIAQLLGVKKMQQRLGQALQFIRLLSKP